jgi:hypothetical protein
MKKLIVLILLLFTFTYVVAQEDGSDCTSCCDGIDNDGDGHIDFKDWDCKKNNTFHCSYCTTESSCDNGVDDDGDGLVDALDPDCDLSCDSPIWEENFDSYSNGTMNTTKWTTNYNDCDDADINVGNNYWGVFNGEFRVNDIEGITCCGGSGGGLNDSYLITEKINVSGYSELSISMTARVTGDVECDGNCNSQDLLTAQYEIDGGGWNTFYTMCGASSGTIELDCEPITVGTELQIRVLVGNQANTETYYFDDIKVCPDNCGNTPLTLPPPKQTVEKEDTIVVKTPIEYYTYDLRYLGKEIPTTTGVYIVVYDDYTRGKIFISFYP